MNEKDQTSHSGNRVLLMCAIIVILIIVVCILLFLLRGSTVVNSGNEAIVSTESLVCESNKLEYPFFIKDSAKKKYLKISATFYEDSLNEISLIYRLSYDNNTEAKDSEARNHANLGKSFGNDSLSVDAFGANFSILEDDMQLSLHAYAKEIGSLESKYFLLDGTNGNHRIDNLDKYYSSRGLSCVSKRY